MDSLDESRTDPAAARDHVGSLAKGLAVMEILAGAPSGLTLSEVGERAGLTRAGARRFLLTLVATGYAVQDGRKFALSPRLISIARSWISGASLWTFAEPFMRQVSKELGESCSAAVLAGHDVVYVARVAGIRIVSVALHVGTRLPAYCTAMGRVLLSGKDDDEVARLLGEAPISARTQHTVTDRRELGAMIARARREGFAVADEELELGLRSIAVPIRDRTGQIVAAINVSTQSARASVEEMEKDFLPLLRQAATRIEDFFVVQ
jgi:IclR family transcriptional regulator, pca regulon regulatory protein